MIPSKIDETKFVLPAGTVPVKFAEHQPQYETLPSLKTPDGKVVSQWTPTDEERQRILSGEPLTLIVWTFNRPLQPVALMVGGADLT